MIDKLSELEFNAIEKILKWSHLGDSFEVTEADDGQDVFFDFEENDEVPLKEGLGLVADNIMDENFSDLNTEEQLAIRNLMKRYGIKLDV